MTGHGAVLKPRKEGERKEMEKAKTKREKANGAENGPEVGPQGHEKGETLTHRAGRSTKEKGAQTAKRAVSPDATGHTE